MCELLQRRAGAVSTVYGVPACANTAQIIQSGAVCLMAVHSHHIAPARTVGTRPAAQHNIVVCHYGYAFLGNHLSPVWPSNVSASAHLAQPAQHRVPCKRQLRVCAGTVSSNDFKNGMTLEIDGAPWRVQGVETYLHMNCSHTMVACGDMDPPAAALRHLRLCCTHIHLISRYT
jgi:hypothetical protein